MCDRVLACYLFVFVCVSVSPCVCERARVLRSCDRGFCFCFKLCVCACMWVRAVCVRALHLSFSLSPFPSLPCTFFPLSLARLHVCCLAKPCCLPHRSSFTKPVGMCTCVTPQCMTAKCVACVCARARQLSDLAHFGMAFLAAVLLNAAAT